MALRFYRRVHVLPGLSVNLSHSGPSLSVGVRGAHVTVGRRGIVRTVGIPGSGVFYTSRAGYHSGVHHDGQGGGAWAWLIVAAGAVLVAAALLAR